jgi:hypothetical protein
MVNILGDKIAEICKFGHGNRNQNYYSKIRGIPPSTKQAPNRKDFGRISKLV